jgi:hypothetical protein
MAATPACSNSLTDRMTLIGPPNPISASTISGISMADAMLCECAGL